MALLFVGVGAGMRVPVGFVGFAPDMGASRRGGGVGFENRGQKNEGSLSVCVYHNYAYIERIRNNPNTQGEDWVNNFVDPCHGIL